MLTIVPRGHDIDRVVRARLRAWMIHFMRRKGLNQKDFATYIGVAQPTVHNIVKTRAPQTMGLDVLIKLSARCKKPIDDMIESWPDDWDEQSDNPYAAGPPAPDPRSASGVAEPGRQHKAGGKAAN